MKKLTCRGFISILIISSFLYVYSEHCSAGTEADSSDVVRESPSSLELSEIVAWFKIVDKGTPGAIELVSSPEDTVIEIQIGDRRAVIGRTPLFVLITDPPFSLLSDTMSLSEQSKPSSFDRFFLIALPALSGPCGDRREFRRGTIFPKKIAFQIDADCPRNDKMGHEKLPPVMKLSKE